MLFIIQALHYNKGQVHFLSFIEKTIFRHICVSDKIYSGVRIQWSLLRKL
jgi:hypothetical protein